MIPVWKEKWATALESGEFIQGVGYLHKVVRTSPANQTGSPEETHFFCPLGVLCKIVADEHPGLLTVERKRLTTGLYEVAYDTRTGLLPRAVIQLTGLDSSDPEINHESIATLNDASKWDFKRIAKVIRREL